MDVSPRKTPEQRTTGRARRTFPSHRRGRIGIRGDADAELIGDATEEIKRLREQLIERDDEIRDLRYRHASARLQSDAVVKVERVIVWRDGHREIEGVTPKQLPAPASHVLPNSTPADVDTSDINDL
jgi:hypothetical protein